MAQIANPIYDASFKYLMDEPRVAKTLIAAVLKIDKKDILELTPDRNEISIYKQDDIRACRLDFTVRIKTKSGEKSIYIELQKVWSRNEMQRFRSYLATQFDRISNVADDNYPLPILSIYIIGETVDHLNDAVTYITRHYYNQVGIVINKECPSWFLECLSHDMVVIQAPKTKARSDSTLDNLLTFFDQRKKIPNYTQLIDFNINDYGITSGELYEDMNFFARRLERAFENEEVRIQMCLEDKVYEIYYGKIDAEEKLVEQEKLLQEKDSQLHEQASQLQEKDSQLQEKDSQLHEQASQLHEQQSQLQEQQSQLHEQASQLQQQAARIAKSIKKMYSRCESIEEIAEDFEVSVEYVKSVLKL